MNQEVLLDAKLFQAVVEKDITEIAKIAFEATEFPILIMDYSISVVAMYPKEPIGEKTFDSYLKDPHPSLELLDDLIKYRYYEHMTMHKGLQLLDWGIHKDFPRLCGYVFDQDTAIGYSTMLCKGRKPTESDYTVLNKCIQALALIMPNHYLDISTATFRSVAFVRELFRDKHPDATLIQNWATRLAINLSGPFFVMTARISATRGNIYLSYIFNYLRMNYQHLQVMMDQSDLICFFAPPGRQSAEIETREVIGSVSNYLMKEGFTCGLSMPFYRLENACLARDQSAIALRAGNYFFRDDSFFDFSNLLPYCLLENIVESEQEKVFIHPAFERIREYDQSKNTRYYQTLKTYLENFKHIGQTVKMLNIHRNTLDYRLEKINGLFNIDLDDTALCIFLLIGFYLEDYKGNE